MSIIAITRQAQGIRAGEVIAKLAEDAYFMRVDNRVNQPPPARHCDNEATSRSANNGPNRTRAELPAEPSRTALAPTPADLHSVTTATARSSPTALRPAAAATTQTAVEATAEARTMEPTRGLAAAAVTAAVVWTSLGPLPWWVPGPTTRWAPGTTRLALHGT
jgi:hypothetical protein